MSHACHRFWKCRKTLTFCSLLTRCTIPCACHAQRHLNVQKWSEHVVFFTFWLRNVLRATTACTFSTSQLPEVVRTCGAFNMFTSKCALRHNGVRFFDISTSKSGPDLVCFVTRTFWLWNALRATTACNFSSLIWPAGSAPAAFASLLFEPPGPQTIGKTHCFATLLPFRAPGSSFFWLFRFSSLRFASLRFSSLLFSSLTLPTSALHLPILSEVWLLNFLRSCVWLGGAYVGGKKAPSNVFWGKLYLARWAPTPREAPLRNMNASVCFGMHFWTVCARVGLMVQMCRTSLLTQGSQWTDNQLRIQHSHFIEVSGLPGSGTNRSPQSYDRNLQEREHKPQRSLAESVLGQFCTTVPEAQQWTVGTSSVALTLAHGIAINGCIFFHSFRSSIMKAGTKSWGNSSLAYAVLAWTSSVSIQ